MAISGFQKALIVSGIGIGLSGFVAVASILMIIVSIPLALIFAAPASAAAFTTVFFAGGVAIVASAVTGSISAGANIMIGAAANIHRKNDLLREAREESQGLLEQEERQI